MWLIDEKKNGYANKFYCIFRMLFKVNGSFCQLKSIMIYVQWKESKRKKKTNTNLILMQSDAVVGETRATCKHYVAKHK